MLELGHLLEQLPERHQAALRWFAAYSGQEQSWPRPLADGTLLASRAKGIYKPGWTKYAVSVRQSLTGPYPDRNPVARSDGTWSYLYFQENPDPRARDSEYTNRGMMECLRDSVPIGVMRQSRARPKAKYQILGLAIVAGWDAGYFLLEGFSPDGKAHQPSSRMEVAALAALYAAAALEAGAFEPESLVDGRERIVASIVRRRGQPEFRRALLEAYGGRCAISGCNGEEALEAAHILPYGGPQTNSLSNGLLLRADLHTLFDLGLWAIDTATMTVLLAPELTKTSYSELAGRPLRVPDAPSARPSREALDTHRRWGGLPSQGDPQ